MAQIIPILKSLIRNPDQTELIYGLASELQTRIPRASDRYFAQLDRLSKAHNSDLDRVLNLNQLPIEIVDLQKCGPETLGRHLVEFYQLTQLTPALYQLPLQGASPRMAKLVTASRNIHDALHIITGLDTSVEDEMCLQAFLGGNTKSSYSLLLVLLGFVHLALYSPQTWLKTARRCRHFWKQGRRAPLVLNYDFHEIVKTQLTDAKKTFGTH